MRRELINTTPVPKTEQELIDLHNKKIAIENEINEVSATKVTVVKKIGELENQGEVLKKDTEGFVIEREQAMFDRDTTFTDLNSFKDLAEEKKKDIKAEIQKVLDVKTDLETQVKDAQDELVSLEVRAKTAQNVIDGFNTVIDDLEVQEADIRTTIVEKSKVIRLLDDEISAKKTDIAIINGKIEEQMRKLVSKEAMDAYSLELQKLVEQVNNKSEEIKRLDLEHDQVIADTDAAKKDLAEKQIEMDEKFRTISIADQRLTERVQVIEAMIENGKAKGYINDKVQL